MNVWRTSLHKASSLFGRALKGQMFSSSLSKKDRKKERTERVVTRRGLLLIWGSSSLRVHFRAPPHQKGVDPLTQSGRQTLFSATIICWVCLMRNPHKATTKQLSRRPLRTKATISLMQISSGAIPNSMRCSCPAALAEPRRILWNPCGTLEPWWNPR